MFIFLYGPWYRDLYGTVFTCCAHHLEPSTSNYIYYVCVCAEREKKRTRENEMCAQTSSKHLVNKLLREITSSTLVRSSNKSNKINA